MRSLARGLGLLVAPIIVACSIQACGGDDKDSTQPPQQPNARSKKNQKDWVVDTDPVTGSADLLVALTPLPPSVVDGNYEKAARDFIEQHKDQLKLTNPSAQLALIEIAFSAKKTAHVSFAQKENGVRVEGITVNVHFRPDGSIAMVTGPIVPDANKTSTTPAITDAAAIAAAEAHIKAKIPTYDATKLTAPATPKLALIQDGAGAKLAWKIRFASQSPVTFNADYFIDAQTGAVMNATSRIASTDGSGVGVLGDTKQIVVRDMPAAGGRYAMYRGGIPGAVAAGRERIVTHKWMGENVAEVIIRSDDPNSWDVVPVGSGAAVDAHRYTGDATDWYRKNVGWASFDGRGSPLKVIAHDNRILQTFSDGTTATNNENAFWDGSGGMHYGDGSLHQGGNVKPTSCALDVVGHEFTHGVTQYTSQLAYQNQSGALNEAMSDIFGVYIEDAYAPPGSATFTIGEAAWPDGGIRDMAHPKTKNMPDNMKELYTGANDSGGVHTNSNIINNTWYLMTWGGKNDTSGIEVAQSLGMDVSRQLWWHTNRHLLNAGSNFDRAARDQIGWAKVQGMPLEAVACAWVATGVVTNDYVKSNYNVSCYCDDGEGGVQQPEAMKCCEEGKEDQCCKQCVDAATEDGGAPVPDPEGPEPQLFDSCKGRADGVYCSQLDPNSAIVCEGETIASGQQCAGTRCIGPDGPGNKIQCEGQDPAPPPLPDDNTPLTPDSCASKGDGIYCSSLAPNSAYECKDGSIASGQQCADEKTCVGPNGAGTAVVCR